MSARVTILEDRHGTQPRAYAGDEWSGTITFEHNNLIPRDVWHRWERVPREEVDRWVRFITGYKDDGEGDWYTPRLKLLEPVEPGVWRYRVERPYDD